MRDPVDVIRLARQPIRTPSPNPPGNEREVAGVARSAIDALGFPAAGTHTRAERRPNPMFSADVGTGGRQLLLCGHLDTKPVGDADWTVDTFDHAPERDRPYGPGPGDMKAAIAAMLVAVARRFRTPPERGRVSVSVEPVRRPVGSYESLARRYCTGEVSAP